MTKKKDPYRSFPEVARTDEKEERKDGLIPLRRAITTKLIVAIITDRVDLRKKRRNSRGRIWQDQVHFAFTLLCFSCPLWLKSN